MAKSSEPILSPGESQDLNRRELLKILAAAGGGLAAVAFLPGKWLKPVVEAGVLPAHAQATDTLRIMNLSVWRLQERSQQSGNGVKPYFRGSAYYQDDYCKVGVEPTQLVGSCPSLSSWSVGSPNGSCSGVLGFSFYAACNQVLSVYLEVGSRQSAPASKTLICSSS
jgi:hypothetical protein